MTNEKEQIERLKKEIESYKQEMETLEKLRDQVFLKCEILDTILDSLPHPFYVINATNYAIKVANKAALRGRKKENQTCHALTHRRNTPCSGKEHRCPLEIIQKTKKSAVVEHIHYDDNGKPVYVEIFASPIFDKNGNIVEMIEYSIDITKRKRAEQKLSHMATHDALTNLPNRTLFHIRMEMEIAHTQRNKNKLAVLLIDLDGFKKINDTLGHGAGDELLVNIGQVLRDAVRKSDTVARMGGDEFLLLLPELTDRHDAELIVHKILRLLRQPLEVAGREERINASIGIAICPDDAQDVETMIRFADIAMYDVKNTGGGSYRFHAATEDEEMFPTESN
ncbi:MAG: hypothetical protein BM485_06465 [Desulfobulbaceae bacterium DB1]|nr:MAG: hypothetical protein BM485_06465 [Desulfobulbaceae bacterium DB1]